MKFDMFMYWTSCVLFVGSIASLLLLQEYMRTRANAALPKNERIPLGSFSTFGGHMNGYRIASEFTKLNPGTVLPRIYYGSFLGCAVGLVGMAITGR
jgi:hypothetical protein